MVTRVREMVCRMRFPWRVVWQHRLCEGFSSCISESRDQRYIRHDLLKLIRQRVLQIVAGYEDCNDADTLRSDPMLKTVCDQLPESDPDLATQPTFSRLENSVTRKDLMRLSQWLLGRYVRSLKKRRPGKIILDLDIPTTTPTASRSSPSTTGITEATFCILC